MALDLRSNKPTPPAPIAGIQLPGPGILPLTPGTAKRLTPYEENQLKQLNPNWKQGDPVPASLAGAIEQIKNEAENYSGLPVPPNTPPIVVTEDSIIDISTLPPEKQEELRKAMDAMTARQAELLKNAAAVPTQAAPGLAEAIAEAQRANIPQPASQQTQPVMPMAQPVAPAPLEPELPPSAITPAVSHCPHCQWDLAEPDDVVPKDAEKRHFLQAVLGGKRFTKNIHLFGDSLVITFRTLTTSESMACIDQVGADLRDERITMLNFRDQLQYYRVCCGLQSVITTLPTVVELPPLADVQYDKEIYRTALPAYLHYIKENVLIAEHIFRVVGREFSRFQRLTEKLEQNMDNPDFYKGIP